MSLQSQLGDNAVETVVVLANISDPPMTLDEKREKRTAAHRLIQTKYDAGIPFFTKDLFRDVVRQLESGGYLDQKVSVTGLDGVTVQFPLKTGREYLHHAYGENYVCIIAKPLLEYHTIERLLAVRDPEFYSVCRAYLPVEVAHSTEVRNAQTNELVNLWPASDYATVRQRLEQAKRSFEGSEYFARLRSTLASIEIPPGINKIVALHAPR